MRVKNVTYVCLALLQFPVTSLRSAELQDCHLKLYASLDLADDPSKALVVPVTIQGSAAHMLFGADNAFGSLTKSAAQRLSLQLHPIPFSHDLRMGNRPLRWIAIAKQFALGSLTFNGAEFLVEPDDMVATNVIGTVGTSMFSKFDIEIDIANGKLNLYSQEHCEGNVVYWSKTYDSVPIYVGEIGELYFPMQLNGKKIIASLQTDIEATTLSIDVARRLFDIDISSAEFGSATGVNGGTTAQHRTMQLSAKGLNVINADIELVKRPAVYCKIDSHVGATDYEGCVGLHPLRLGVNLLKKLHIYIAMKEKILYFTPAVAAN